MQTKVFLSAGVALVSGFLLAGDGTMKSWADLVSAGLNDGTSITSAADFDTADYWIDGIIGGGKESTVTLPETLYDLKQTRTDGLRFVTSDEPLTVGCLSVVRSTTDWYAMLSNRVCFVSDRGVRISHDAKDGPTANDHKSLALHGRLYADVTADENIADCWVDGHLELCGDCQLLAQKAQLSIGSSLRHRLDLYAKDANPVRRNPIQATTIYRAGAYLIYAPRGADEQVGRWSQTEGSPYLFRTGAAHPLAAGTTVTGAGIPEGTFLKRVFTDGSIELSAPVTSTVEGNTVTFAAFTPDVYQYFAYAHRSTKAVENFGLVKFRPQDKLRVEVGNFSNFRALTLVHTDERVNLYGGKMYPGTLVVHEAYAQTEPVRLGDCHLEFAFNSYNQAVHPNGFENATLMSYGPDYVARLTVTNNLSAVCSMSNITSTVVKDGLGTLISGFNAELASNTGRWSSKRGFSSRRAASRTPRCPSARSRFPTARRSGCRRRA